MIETQVQESVDREVHRLHVAGVQFWFFLTYKQFSNFDITIHQHLEKPYSKPWGVGQPYGVFLLPKGVCLFEKETWKHMGASLGTLGTRVFGKATCTEYSFLTELGFFFFSEDVLRVFTS
jgi:hypothetical protein